MSLVEGWVGSVGGAWAGWCRWDHFGGRWTRYRFAWTSLAGDELAVTWGDFAAAWPGVGFIPCELRKRQLDRMALQMGP
jgi:hypothetical protein